MCNMSGKGPAESLSVKDKTNTPTMAIHQGEEEEGPLCMWAVVKPGNTKEKIAFFAAHQCSNRTGSMKIKSTWDIDGRATKRRKKSVDLKKVKIQLERMKETNIRPYQSEPFACDIEHCSLHYMSDSGNGFYPGRPASVIEMVAFLEQRASALLATCTKNCLNSSATLRFARQSKEVPPASDLFCVLEAHGESPPRENSKGSKPQGETVHVLDMVARLESECLKHQREREMGGGLSRNNSFRRHVGRVLLANGTQADGKEAEKESPEIPDTQANPAVVTRDCNSERLNHCSSLQGTQSWECASTTSLPTCVDFHMDNVELVPSQQTAVKTRSRCDVEMTEELGSSFLSLTCPKAFELPSDTMQSKSITIDCMSKKIVPFPSQNPDQRMRESVCISISVSRVEKEQDSSISLCEDPLPGMLFFLQPNQPEKTCSKSNESKRGSPRPLPNADSSEDEPELGGKGVSVVEPFALPRSTLESTMGNALQVLEGSFLKKQVSHDFLETRFKIQQLLEPPQYMAFLPHHIMVKIFRFLPTKSLVALKCTCCYFKFIIEYYNIRPADSRWVRDPRYKEDPCKKCKKKYVKGDVSLCRWHPKPYCQALPYGPGYWMCCHRSQKGVPGCKLGLHDNHWVPDLRG
ncbi:F-box only protein 34 [Monodelphis domestica]|uniref:F-box only protein 34 n=1 Tax=Monodelphis domestica TaxID=13616 RepID=UPI0024E1A3F6|nr:F-box only protein 34 [Monodelphis domestica]XP_016283505.2 F-box only protein 34 [Monodelphis domestica]XP_056666755.1 F-box only protein 34 [Monodelphis domestica]XP_056666756.1 F-box only protein 34 [Monodelphis domestica]XP_056666758.1 F-box only protein 34 [Monodelphis domestica]XP_056666759.1 F-box only protein 34 [Monodelphis domestica]XP_056666760.1 F-box only protein 34 [Monodelphis domestica]